MDDFDCRVIDVIADMPTQALPDCCGAEAPPTEETKGQSPRIIWPDSNVNRDGNPHPAIDARQKKTAPKSGLKF